MGDPFSDALIAGSLIADFVGAAAETDIATAAMDVGSVAAEKAAQDFGKRVVEKSLEEMTSSGKRQKSVTVTAPQTSSSSTQTPPPKVTVTHTKADALRNGNIVNPMPFYDSSRLVNDQNRLTKIQLKAGKCTRVWPDAIDSFLKALTQNGVVRTQFAGRIACKEDYRHVHFQVFRHNLSKYADANAQPVDYPLAWFDRLLTPSNPNLFKIQGPGDPDNTGYLPGTTSFRDMLPGINYFHPLNRADFEDMSWNLNAFKLSPTISNNQVPQAIHNQVPTLLTHHGRASYMYQMNSQVPNITPGPNSVPAPFQFKHVFNYGKIQYEFMNKGDGGAKVELIVFTVKRNHQITSDASKYMTTNSSDSTLINQKLEKVIGAGYINSQTGRFSTDLFSGRVPDASDISSNPNFPLFPQLRTTKQGEHDFTELTRASFALTSGARRVVDVVLPGDTYNPVDIPLSDDSTPTGGLTFGIMDTHSYFVAIAVNGVVCSNEYSLTVPTPASLKTTIVGDTYAGANVQFYSTYTEHIGAATYDNSKKTPMHFSFGGLLPVVRAFEPGQNPQDPPVFSYDTSPVTMLPQSTAARIPGTTNASTGASIQSPSNYASNDPSVMT